MPRRGRQGTSAGNRDHADFDTHDILKVMDEEEVAVAAQLLATTLRIAALLAFAALVATGLWLWRRAG